MRGSVRIVPAFGLAAMVVAQPCGCWEGKLLLGPIELGAIEGRWCRNKGQLGGLPQVRVEIHTPALAVIWDLDRAEAESFANALLAACHRNLWPRE